MAKFIELRLASTDDLRNVKQSEIGLLLINVEHIKLIIRDTETGVGSLLVVTDEENCLHVLDTIDAIKEKIRSISRGRA